MAEGDHERHMSFEISEVRDGEGGEVNRADSMYSGGGPGAALRDEFYAKVPVPAIMRGANTIDREAARMMLSRFRGVPLSSVSPDDTAILMLDGVGVDGLNDFLREADETLQEMIRGEEDDDDYVAPPPHAEYKSDVVVDIPQPTPYDPGRDHQISLSPANNRYNDPPPVPQADNARRPPPPPGAQQQTSLTELRGLLWNFHQTEDTRERDAYRKEFFACYRILDPRDKQLISMQQRSMIESAQTLGPSNQTTILYDINLAPTEQEKTGGVVGYEKLHANDPAISIYEAAYANQGQAQTQVGPGGQTSTSLPGEFGDFEKRQVARAVTIVETQNLLKWIKENRRSQHVVFFFLGLVVSASFFLQIWVDYAFAQIWRAILMELLSLSGALICIIEADTSFIRSYLQNRVFRYWSFLQNVNTRCYFYFSLSFLALGRFNLFDLLAIAGGVVLFVLSLIRWILYVQSDKVLTHLTYNMVDDTWMRDKFNQFDSDQDGYLSVNDISNMIEYNGCGCLQFWMAEIVFWRMDSVTNDGHIDMNEFVVFCSNWKDQQNLVVQRRQSRIAQYKNSHPQPPSVPSATFS